MSELRYTETVPASLAADLLLGTAGAVTAVLTVVLVVGGEALGALGAGIAAVALFAAFRSFRRLLIEVDDEELRASFGSFKKRIRLDEVATAEAARYQWLPYLGWGIRFGLSHRRAYSVPFRMTGVELQLPSTRWYVSSQRPQELAAVLQQTIEQRRADG